MAVRVSRVRGLAGLVLTGFPGRASRWAEERVQFFEADLKDGSHASPLDVAQEARQKAQGGCVDRAVQCQLSAHEDDEHYGLLAELATYGTTLWLRRRGTGTDLIALPDCPATGPGPDEEGCCLFADHTMQRRSAFGRYGRLRLAVRETQVMDGIFRLRRQTDRWARFAEVSVRVVPAASTGVVVRADVLRWGHPAAVDGAGDAGALAEARAGAWYALRELPVDVRSWLVEVTEIAVAPADSGPGDVKFAAAHAVWQALGHLPSRPPFTGEDGNPVFPAEETPGQDL
ncbi:hypothetical protein [Streptomyces sp. NPDC059452]|uniref:hypothetical protein n=1 Tax=Streptomyces sp. NPDC059452 TaxID=3346835 RepID=UPI0036A05AF7